MRRAVVDCVLVVNGLQTSRRDKRPRGWISSYKRTSVRAMSLTCGAAIIRTTSHKHTHTAEVEIVLDCHSSLLATHTGYFVSTLPHDHLQQLLWTRQQQQHHNRYYYHHHRRPHHYDQRRQQQQQGPTLASWFFFGKSMKAEKSTGSP